jgi:hypothetical protein
MYCSRWVLDPDVLFAVGARPRCTIHGGWKTPMYDSLWVQDPDVLFTVGARPRCTIHGGARPRCTIHGGARPRCTIYSGCKTPMYYSRWVQDPCTLKTQGVVAGTYVHLRRQVMCIGTQNLWCLLYNLVHWIISVILILNSHLIWMWLLNVQLIRKVLILSCVPCLLLNALCAW